MPVVVPAVVIPMMSVMVPRVIPVVIPVPGYIIVIAVASISSQDLSSAIEEQFRPPCGDSCKEHAGRTILGSCGVKGEAAALLLRSDR